MANVMIVDDSFVMRQKIKTVLTQSGHHVVEEAETGTQAYNKYIRCHPDLVTMDINMPSSNGIMMDGIDTVKKILCDYPEAKIVMISSAGQKNMVLSAIQSGAKNYIVKPFEDEKFMAVINKVLGIETVVKKDPVQDNYGSDGTNNGDAGSEDVKQEDGTAFSISVKNDFFTIKIKSNFDCNSKHFLSTAIQGLLFVEPLNVIVDFDLTEFLETELMNEVFLIFAMIEKSNGKIQYFSRVEKLIKDIESKQRGIQIHLYAGPDELPKNFV